MVTHFSVATGEVACGRNNHYVSGTRDKLRVSCRNCRSTEVFKTHSDAQADSGGGHVGGYIQVASCVGSGRPDPPAS